MNDTGNNSENNTVINDNQVNAISQIQQQPEPTVASPELSQIQEPAPAVAPAVSEPQPVVTSQAQPEASTQVQTETSAQAKPEQQQSDVSSTTGSENNGNAPQDKENVTENVATDRKFPFAIVIIVLALIGAIAFYFLVWITPEKVFDSAIDDAIGGITNVLRGLNNSEHKTTNIYIDSELRTAGPTTKNDKNIEFVDGLKVGADVGIDIENFDIGVRLFSDLEKTSENMQYGDKLDMAFDYIGENIYVDMGEHIGKFTTESNIEKKYAINYQKLDDCATVIEKIKDQVIDTIDNKTLKRTIKTKKIVDQTALTIEASTHLNNEDIKKIWDIGFTNLYEDTEFMDKLANVLGLTKEETKELVGTKIIENHDVVTQDIDVKIYMNLANTKMIGLEVWVDKYIAKLNYLNGYYYIDFKIKDTKDGKIIDDSYLLDIVATYDDNKGILDLTGIAKTENETYLEVDVEYVRKVSENNKMVGNTLDFKFYDEDVINSNKKGAKPFCTLNCTLDISYDNKDVKLADVTKAVELTSVSGGEINKLTYTLEKLIYEYKFVYGRLLYNRKDDTFREKYLADSVTESKNIVSKLVSSAAGSITYEQMLEMSVSELKEKMELLKDFDEEQKEAAYDSIVGNIKSSLTYEEINKLTYDQTKELLKSKLTLLDKKYQNQVYDAITDVMKDKLTYEFIKEMNVDDEKELMKKDDLLPDANQKAIMNHIIDVVKQNVTYDDIVKMPLDEVKDLLSRVNVLPDNYKKTAYTEITNIITPNLKYDEIVAMSNDEINALMDKVEILPDANQKTILNKVADVIKGKVTYSYMLDLKLADEKDLLAKVELLPNKKTVYSNIASAVNKGLTAKEMAALSVDKVSELLEKVKLLPKSTQESINKQIVKASKELMQNTGKYNVTLNDLIPKVCKLPKEVADQIQPGVVGSSMCK